MSRQVPEPEFILAEPEKTVLTVKQLDNFVRILRDMEVDSVVLYKELSKLEGFSGRIADDIRALVLLLVDMQEARH